MNMLWVMIGLIAIAVGAIWVAIAARIAVSEEREARMQAHDRHNKSLITLNARVERLMQHFDLYEVHPDCTPTIKTGDELDATDAAKRRMRGDA